MVRLCFTLWSSEAKGVGMIFSRSVCHAFSPVTFLSIAFYFPPPFFLEAEPKGEQPLQGQWGKGEENGNTQPSKASPYCSTMMVTVGHTRCASTRACTYSHSRCPQHVVSFVEEGIAEQGPDGR